MDPLRKHPLPSRESDSSSSSSPFCLLGVRSFYTFLDSTLPAETLPQQALQRGATALALTDTNTLAGAVVFYRAARSAGLQPILGAELTQPWPEDRTLLRKRAAHPNAQGGLKVGLPTGLGLLPPSSPDLPDPWSIPENSLLAPLPQKPSRTEKGRSQSPQLQLGNRLERAFVFTTNLQGYHHLSHAISDRQLNPEFDLVETLGSLLIRGQVIVVVDRPRILEVLLNRLPSPRLLAHDQQPALYAGLLRGREAREQNRQISELAQRHQLSWVTLADVSVADSSEIPHHTLLQAMRQLKTIWQIPEAQRLSPSQVLAGAKEFRQDLIRGLTTVPGTAEDQELMAETALRESAQIAHRCSWDLPLGQWKFPTFQGVGDEPGRLLRELVDRGLRQRYGHPVPEAPRARADQELAVVERLGFCEYFLLVHRIVSEGHSRGFFTVGRGSGANSILSYALRFTEVCPLRYNLYFERFLNPERSVPPDIDIDFSWRDRDELLQWCFEFFGPERVALIGTVQTLQTRQAIREVARAFGVPPADADRFTALAETGFIIEDQGRRRCLAEEEPWKSILQQALALRDFPRHFSIHCGGILITPGEVRDWVPLTRSAKGFVITQMDMYSIEDLGLIKIDLLSNRSLGVLKDGLRMACENLGRNGGLPKIDGEQTTDNLRDALPKKRDRISGPETQETPETPETAPSRRGEIFQREAQRMKLAGSRRGTSVALAGVLGILADQQSGEESSLAGGSDSGVPARALASPHLLRQRILDFEFVTRDPATRALIDQGRTMGCFYIESPGMRALFERLKCQNFEEVVAASSIIRPGVAESGMMAEYIQRHQSRPGALACSSDSSENEPCLPGASQRLATGLMPVNAHSKPRLVREYLGLHPTKAPRPATGTAPAHQRHQNPSPSSPSRSRQGVPIHPRMMEILPETYGVMVYQEDVLRVAHEIAGMSYAEADTLRRAMSGKARSREAMLALEERFVLGACQRTMTEADAREVWRQMASFAGYSFCKGHSAAFAVLSYQVSYLKAHFPGEFVAALISNQGGFYGPGPYLEEARRWGIHVLHPCVQSSELECFGRTVDPDPWSRIEPWLHPLAAQSEIELDPEALRQDPRIVPQRPAVGMVRLGLNMIQGVRGSTIQRILAERQRGGSFAHLDQFCQRCTPQPEEGHRLIDAGALDALEDPEHYEQPGALRPRLHLQLELSLARLRHSSSDDLLQGAMAPPVALSSPQLSRVDRPVWGWLETCLREVQALGFMVSAHPLDFISEGQLGSSLNLPPLISARAIRAFSGKKVRMLGWMVAAKILRTKTKAEPMKMLTLEDRTDTFEATLFPKVYSRLAPRTLTQGPYLVQGVVDTSLGSPVLTVSHLEVLSLQEPTLPTT